MMIKAEAEYFSAKSNPKLKALSEFAKPSNVTKAFLIKI
jgi:hypothetical protein